MCLKYKTFIIHHSNTGLSVGVLTFLQIPFPPKEPEPGLSSPTTFNNQLVNMSKENHFRTTSSGRNAQ
jgi:hypothetical protein